MFLEYNWMDKNMIFDLDMIKKTYEYMNEKIDLARSILKRPLMLSEKILYTHLHNLNIEDGYKNRESYVDFLPNRVAMQDATAQMALLQFMMAGKSKVSVSSSVHCDHLIQAKYEAGEEDIIKCNHTYNDIQIKWFKAGSDLNLIRKNI